MKKTLYIIPEAEVLTIDALQLLSGSVNEGNNDKNEDLITDPSELGAKGGSFWNVDNNEE